MNGHSQGTARESAAKKRLKYVQTQIDGACTTIFCATLSFASGITALLLLLCSGFPEIRNVVPLAAPGFLGIAVLFGFGARNSARRAASVPYVPPVREQIAALPAQEILVRGSDRPTALSNELLRTACVGEGTTAEELLRAGTRATE